MNFRLVIIVVKQILGEIEEELWLLEEDINTAIHTNINFIREPLKEMILNGGKRLRPAMVLSAARFGNYNYKDIKKIAVIVELIHTATLIHDDIVDDSNIRRGIPSLQSRLGKDVAVFAGDFVFCRVFELLTSFGDTTILKNVSRVMSQICEGELKQREDAFNTEISIKDYLFRIRRKTALLFALSCKLGAITSDVPHNYIRYLFYYGLNIGMAFQVIDDLLDIIGDEDKLGKPLGVDIKEGVVTLPTLYALRYSEEKERLKEILSKPEKEEDIEQALNIIKSSGAVDYTKQFAHRYIKKACHMLTCLPEKPIRKVLIEVSEHIITRCQ